MIHRLRPLVLVALACSLIACDDEPELDTGKDVASDPLGDVAYLGGSLYATNEDHSGHGGSQVDLMEFGTDGTERNRTALALNGMGYLAATADGQLLYLQARGTGQLFAVSPAGEFLWTRADPTAGGGRFACGVAHRADVDSFVAMYHDRGTTAYTTLRYGPGFTGAAGTSATLDLPAFAPESGVTAVAWAAGRLWALGRDARGEAIIQGIGDDGTVTRIINLDDETACGLAAGDDVLHIAYPDRRFESLDTTGGAR